MIDRVLLSKKAIKNLKSLPAPIKDKFLEFTHLVQTQGYLETLSYRSYKDEPLIGKRKGQRSIRLNRSYRVIYKLELGEVFILNIMEINKHGY